MVGALGVDPEFQHPARSVECARDAALAVQFADVADVDKHNVRIAFNLIASGAATVSISAFASASI